MTERGQFRLLPQGLGYQPLESKETIDARQWPAEFGPLPVRLVILPRTMPLASRWPLADYFVGAFLPAWPARSAHRWRRSGREPMRRIYPP